MLYEILKNVVPTNFTYYLSSMSKISQNSNSFIKFKLKNFFLVFGLILLIILVTNYIFSDYFYLRIIMSKNDIKTPKNAYNYVISNTDSTLVNNDYVNCRYCSPKYLLSNNHVLACDEGAIIIAHMSTILGYETRLTDIINKKNISNHTILQVQEQGRWKNIDYLFQLYDKDISESTKHYDFSHLRYRKYPKIQNRIIYNFYILKKMICFIRNCKG
jgi:hypothetical protein